MRPYLRLHYSLKHVVVASVSRLFANFTYTARRGWVKGMKRKGGLSFLPDFSGSFDRLPEVRFLRSLALGGKVVYDVGAFEGLLTLYWSRRARQVVAYEPLPASAARLRENLRLNRIANVTVRNVALGDAEGAATLCFDRLMPGGASADAQVGGQILSTSDRTGSVAVAKARLDTDLEANRLPDPDFVKIDVEGMELAVLRGMTRTLARAHPALYIEIHGATGESKEQNVRSVMTLLNEHGYDRILHIESGRLVSPADARLARQGHLYAQPGGRGAGQNPRGLGGEPAPEGEGPFRLLARGSGSSFSPPEWRP